MSTPADDTPEGDETPVTPPEENDGGDVGVAPPSGDTPPVEGDVPPPPPPPDPEPGPPDENYPPVDQPG